MKEHTRRKKSLAHTLFFLLPAAMIFFSPALAAADEENNGMSMSSVLQFQFTSLLQPRVVFEQSFTFPFLQGQSPLTKDNNITTVLSANLTPVSTNSSAEITWTPAAFFLLSGGGQAGSGWNILSSYFGIGLNKPVETSSPDAYPRERKIVGKAFDGLIWSSWGAATMQFDLGALLPGDWTHVVFQARQEFRYSAYTRADIGDSWVFENDQGENQNGWKYIAKYLIGYRMPASPVLETVAISAELDKPLYQTPGGDSWGENLGIWYLSGYFIFKINPKLNAVLGIQMRSFRNYGDIDLRNHTYHFKDLEVQHDGGSRRILFYRAAVVFAYKIY